MREIAGSIVVMSGAALIAFGSYLNQANTSGGLAIVFGIVALCAGLFFIANSGGTENGRTRK
jgi:hypothetical protein